jgi:hypothetical protein
MVQEIFGFFSVHEDRHKYYSSDIEKNKDKLNFFKPNFYVV